MRTHAVVEQRNRLELQTFTLLRIAYILRKISELSDHKKKWIKARCSTILQFENGSVIFKEDL
jgi:hypothetical protein